MLDTVDEKLEGDERFRLGDGVQYNLMDGRAVAADNRIRMTAFSDSIVYSMEIRSEESAGLAGAYVCRAAALCAVMLARRGFFCRGGVARGGLYWHDRIPQ